MAYVEAFRGWVDHALRQGEREQLADYRNQAPHAARAHPTEEHFLPLFIALGAAKGVATPERLLDYVEGGALAMDAYVFH
jgi:4,5-DOPA dioxygenase extradiol